jgi:hypothetical protein
MTRHVSKQLDRPFGAGFFVLWGKALLDLNHRIAVASRLLYSPRKRAARCARYTSFGEANEVKSLRTSWCGVDAQRSAPLL